MNQNLEKLCRIGSKKTRIIIGLMSGTSLDGLDIAVCRFTGSGIETKVDLLQFATIAYQPSFRDELKTVFAKKNIVLEKLCLLNRWVAQQHAQMVLQSLTKWKMPIEEIDLLASHGQTIYHAPKSLHPNDQFGNATLQIGDGDQLAVTTGIITISDFRQKHIAAGGEGAPLAVYGDYFIFSKLNENRIMLNIGGIANFTYLPGNLDAREIFSSDTGPGNTLMDAYTQQHFQLSYDKQASIAKLGKINKQLLDQLVKDPFFEKALPKTTGPELFNLAFLESAIIASGLKSISHFDMMATLNQFTAMTIADTIKKNLPQNQSYSIYASGGGMHNPILMENLKMLLPNYNFYTTADLQINPDAKEALLFAVLANETVAGGEVSMGKGSSDIPSVCMGKISFPG